MSPSIDALCAASACLPCWPWPRRVCRLVSAAARSLRPLFFPPPRRRRPGVALAGGPARRLLSSWRLAPSACPARRGCASSAETGRAWLGVAPFGDRGGQRRHALPGGHAHHGDLPPGPDDAPHRCTRAARCSDAQGGYVAARAGWRRPTMRPPGTSRGCIIGSTAWSTRRYAPSWRPAWNACWATTRGGGTGSRCSAGCRRGELDTPPPTVPLPLAQKPRLHNGWPTTTSRCSATACTTWCTTGAARRAAPGAGQQGWARAARIARGLSQLRRGAATGTTRWPTHRAAAAGDTFQHALHRAPARLQRL